MRLVSIMLADFAEDRDGLLYVQRAGWDTLNVAGPLPPDAPSNLVAVMQGHLVVRLHFHQTETDREHAFEIRITGEDGQEIGKVDGSAFVGKTEGLPPAWEQNVNLVVPLVGLGLPNFGLYSISVLVDRQHQGDQPFRVVKAY